MTFSAFWRWLKRQEQPYVAIPAFTYRQGMEKPDVRYEAVSGPKAKAAAQRALEVSASDRKQPAQKAGKFRVVK